MIRSFHCIAAACGIAVAAAAAFGQSTFDAPMGEFVDHAIDSGAIVNAEARSTVAYSTVARVEDALWMRLYFDEITLAPGSRLRMTSLLDGSSQELDAAGIRMWGNTSAYFNGDSVLVEVIAAPNGAENSFQLDRVSVELADPNLPIGTCGICGGDDRVPSDEDWAGRLAPGGCTASIYNEQSCVVSAGHCMGGNNAVLFRVPESLPNCNTQNPPVEDQFPITGQSSQDAGVGADWAVMTLGTNNLGQTAYERYGEYRPIASTVAPNGAPVSVWGYGQSQTCTLTYTQQLSEGTLNAVNSTHYRALIDITFGNSGSALIRNDEIIGVVTHCDACGNGNIMTRVDLPAFAAARDSLCSAPPANDECAFALPVVDGSIEFSNAGATTSGPDEPGLCDFDGNTNVQADVWFEYVATCDGQVTFSLCDGDQPPKGGACAGFCGQQSPDGCWCDEECDGFGDCCFDICEDCPDLSHCATGGACDGFCGAQSPDGCWCDEQCAGFGDCCSGICDDCPDLSHCASGGGTLLAGFDTKMAVYNGCPAGSGEVIACNNDSCGSLSEITINATVGETYRIRVGGHNGATGDGVLTITCEGDPNPVCDGDFNGDDVVNVSDLLTLLSAWGNCPGCAEDLNGDDIVNVSDLLSLLSAWGDCP